MSTNMRTHLSSVAEENKLSYGSGNVGVCENPQAGTGVGAVAGAGKTPVCESSLIGPQLPSPTHELLALLEVGPFASDLRLGVRSVNR